MPRHELLARAEALAVLGVGREDAQVRGVARGPEFEVGPVGVEAGAAGLEVEGLFAFGRVAEEAEAELRVVEEG